MNLRFSMLYNARFWIDFNNKDKSSWELPTNHIIIHRNIEKPSNLPSATRQAFKRFSNRSNIYKAVSVKSMLHTHPSLPNKEELSLKIENSILLAILFPHRWNSPQKKTILCINIQAYRPFASPQRKGFNKAYKSINKVTPLN